MKFAIDQIRGSYEGKLSADGTTIAGTWTQGLSLPLELRRATPETAYRDPAAHRVHFVTVEKNVKLEVLVEHSIAGEELSSIGTRHPEKVAGLIYLDAGYFYAYYDPAVQTPVPETPPAPADGAFAPAAIMAGTEKYRDIRGPILAIFASPHDPGPGVAQEAIAERQAAAFEKGLPNAKVVRIPNANHYVFLSNEADVLREMNAFIAGLGK